MTSPNLFDLSRRNRKRSPLAGRLVLLALFVLVVLVVVHWRDAFANAFWVVASPITQLRNQAEGNSITQLEAELASTTAALADRDELARENAVLKSQLGRPQSSTQVLAAILLRPPGIPYDTLVVDAGAKQNVAVGDVVFGGGSAAIGDVTEVYADTSRISLFSAPGRTYDAEVAPAADPSQVLPISLEGQGAGSFSGQLPAGSVAAVNDAVLIPGIGSDFLGSVTHIDAPSGASFETLYVQMPVDIFSLRYVEVQTNQ